LRDLPDSEDARGLLLSVLPVSNDFARAEQLVVLQGGLERGQLQCRPELVRLARERIPRGGSRDAGGSTTPDGGSPRLRPMPAG
jgi:hypothetical protein